MPKIQLLISDQPLRQAVLEQLVIGGFNLVAEHVELPEPGAALILDEGAFDKKMQKLLQTEAKEKKYIFLLGETEEDEAGALVTESFPKPLRLGHVIARLQFHFETAPRLRGGVIAFGPYRLEPQMRLVTIAPTGTVIRLTEKETALLEYLGQSNAAVPREELLAAVWGYDGRIDTHTLETHIYQLRRKLGTEDTSEWLINEQGTYRLLRA